VQHRFDDAVARLPDPDWAAEEQHARPLRRTFVEAIGLPGRETIAKWFERSSLHVHSTTRRSCRFAGDYAQLVLACALAMSTAEHPIVTVTDTPAGARIVSYLPRSQATWPGTLTLDLHADDEDCITVDASSTFPRQVFDWFRGRREISRVWQDMRTYLVAMGVQQEIEPGA
jgi:hypothetical protein